MQDLIMQHGPSSFTIADTAIGDCHKGYMDPTNPYYYSAIPRCLPDRSTPNIESSMGSGRVKHMTTADVMSSSQRSHLNIGCRPGCRMNSVRKVDELFPAANGAIFSTPFTSCEYGLPDLSCRGVFDPVSLMYGAQSYRPVVNENSAAIDTFHTADNGPNHIQVTGRTGAGIDYPLAGQYLEGNLSSPHGETIPSSVSHVSTELEHPPVEPTAGWNRFDLDYPLYNSDMMEQYVSDESVTMIGPSLTMGSSWPISTSPGETDAGFNVSCSSALQDSHVAQMPTGICQDISNFGSWSSYPTFADLDFNKALDITAFGAMFGDYGSQSNNDIGASPNILSYADRYPPSCGTLVQDRYVHRPWPETLNSTHRSASSGGHQRRRGCRDKAKDAFLLACKADKNKKMSYKAIKEEGGFDEAVSTLRGRYRTLTKSREARVRKPKWTEKDISVLKEVVKQCLHRVAGDCSIKPNCSPKSAAMVARQNLNRVSWKEVAETMEKVHGCYRFGNATVKKKYLEVMGLVEKSDE